ncbi:hypothetical protein C8J57DRAFT_519312 [Mycena rebaudengoi]|nr:hypothetical protein C8J57DRAFT_519312 [Mycena rebaudengoi]
MVRIRYSSSLHSPMPELDGPEVGAGIDIAVFLQIIELDDEGTHEYSKHMVLTYFSQVTKTFEGMDIALREKNLAVLAVLAQFLMGSAAALGICKVQASCGRMEDYNDLRDKAAGRHPLLSDAQALEKIALLLVDAKRQSVDAEKWLREWYADHGDSFDAVVVEAVKENATEPLVFIAPSSI